MPATVEWENDEKTIIRVTLLNRWLWSDLEYTREQVEQMIDGLTYRVNLIACADNDNWLPGSFGKNMLNMTRSVHPNVGLVVLVNANPLVEQLFRLFINLHGNLPFECAYVKSIEEAQQLLASRMAA
ncbi:MAG: hypothetical protein CL610_23700 [Anaerolineaceae bacterium]|nr:hypothetical protein [Anaerolineaceae bacterium]